jgi:hypothetical protein
MIDIEVAPKCSEQVPTPITRPVLLSIINNRRLRISINEHQHKQYIDDRQT